MTGLSGRTWGSTASERAMEFPCDRHVRRPADDWYRAVDVQAPAPILFRWLCQLRVAPYSYDRIDNLGRRSPRELTPGLDELEVGQEVMGDFNVVEFERDRHLTLLLGRRQWMYGNLAVTYLIVPGEAGHCRLVVKLLIRHAGGPVGRLILNRIGPWLDLVMMRKQLLTLKQCAEQQALDTSGSSQPD